MRTKLVLLAVMVLVFAPGWGADRAPHRAGASELAGRILAPTFDEARSTFQLERTAHPHHRGKLRTSYGKELLSMPTGIRLPPKGDVWVVVLIAICIPALFGRSSERSARAPPRFVTI